MSVLTNYICDKCGAVQHRPDQFWEIGVSARQKGTYGNAYGSSDTPTMDVCRSCLEGLGIHAQAETKASSEYSPPTVESLILQIIERCQEDS